MDSCSICFVNLSISDSTSLLWIDKVIREGIIEVEFEGNVGIAVVIAA